MRPAEARLDEATLDAIQTARGRVPVQEFRLRSDCDDCLFLSIQPSSPMNVAAIYHHIADQHAAEVLP